MQVYALKLLLILDFPSLLVERIFQKNDGWMQTYFSYKGCRNVTMRYSKSVDR